MQIEEEKEMVERAIPALKVKVPKGTSSYQAAWLEGDEASDDNEEYEEVAVDGEDEEVKSIAEEADVEMDIDEHCAKLQAHQQLQFQ